MFLYFDLHFAFISRLVFLPVLALFLSNFFLRTSGTVLKAFVRDCNLTVAIKIVAQTNKKVQEELKKEIDVLKKCKNPNIVAYYGTYTQNDEMWIIMVRIE